MAVRRRLMKAVFFFSAESSEALVGKTSVKFVNRHIEKLRYQNVNTNVTGPDSSIQIEQLPCHVPA